MSIDSVPEKRKLTLIATVVEYEAVINCKRFSSLNKLLRMTAYVLRFIYNAKCKREKRKTDLVTAPELDKAKQAVIRLVQEEAFKEDIRCLKNNDQVQRNSRLIALHPYLDVSGVLRIGGKLKLAAYWMKLSIPCCFKHHIILPCW